MRKSAGFTLIELVIVIVILGILGAVAAPKFLNLQGDAYVANVNTLKNSVQSAATLANAKAILQGDEKKENVTFDGLDGAVEFSGGYPAASADGIIKMLQDSDAFNAAAESDSAYIISETAGVLSIAPRNRGINTSESEKCQVDYTQAAYADADADPVVTEKQLLVKAFVEGC